MTSTDTTDSGFAAGARRRAEEFASSLKTQAENFKKKSFEDLLSDAREFVKENPGKVILVSVAVGVLLGSLLRRSK